MISEYMLGAAVGALAMYVGRGIYDAAVSPPLWEEPEPLVLPLNHYEPIPSREPPSHNIEWGDDDLLHVRESATYAMMRAAEDQARAEDEAMMLERMNKRAKKASFATQERAQAWAMKQQEGTPYKFLVYTREGTYARPYFVRFIL